MARTLNFIEQIEKSSKKTSKLLLSHIKLDVRSLTGNNLRKMLLLTDKTNVNLLSRKDIMQIEYFPLTPDLTWKKTILCELLEYREDNYRISDFVEEEVNAIIDYLCVN